MHSMKKIMLVMIRIKMMIVLIMIMAMIIINDDPKVGTGTTRESATRTGSCC